MASHLSQIPKTAPFAEDEIEILNRVVGPANLIQRAWLAGFLAGIDAQSAPAKPAPVARPAEPLTIVFASESGNSERLAADMGMSQSRVSEFIKELEGAALIEITRRGQGKTNLYKIKFVVQRGPSHPKRQIS